MTNGTIVNEPTAKQLSYLESLLNEAQRMLDERERLTGCEWPEATAEVVRMRDTDGRTRREISAMIDTARTNNGALKAELDSLGWMPDAISKPERATEFVGEGMYLVDGRIFKVLPSRSSNRHYAKELTGESESGFSFSYAPGAMRLIRPEHLMTEAQAREFGRTSGHCCNCAKLLTDPKSIEDGIGPVCKKQRGWK